MIENTTFKDEKDIVLFVKNNYKLNIKSVEKLNRGSANIFLLDKKYILKEFQSKYNKEQVDKEVVIINHLKSKGIKVPCYIKTISGEYSVVNNGKTIILQKFIDGYTLNNNEGNYDQTIECAETYGKIVCALKDLPINLDGGNIEEWFSKEKFEKGLNDHKKLLPLLDSNDEIEKKIIDDLNKKIDMINKVKDIDYCDVNKLTIMNSHGDYNVLQFIYKDGKINAVIDFVSACKMPIVWELIRSYSYIDRDAKNGEFNIKTFIKYIKTFNKYIKLNKYDIKNICYVYLVQILNSNFGYKQYIQNKNTDLLNFAFFRTNLCTYLFNNCELIQKRLEEEL